MISGLRIQARLVRERYIKDVQIEYAQMRMLSLEHHEPLPKWNYTLPPS